MIQKIKRNALVIVAAVIAIFGAMALAEPEAKATPSTAVCDRLDETVASLGANIFAYRSYLIEAFATGRAYNYDSKVQAKNIVDSVALYCPVHLAGIVAAAKSLS